MYPEIMKIQENVLLSGYTTFRTGGPARYFAVVKNISDLKIAVLFAKEKKLSFFVLGKGANVLVSDVGFFGLVIKMEIKGMEVKNLLNKKTRVFVGAGEDWDTFISKTVKRGLVGLENLSLIPSTVGASAVGNIGAYGTEVKDHIFFVEALHTETMKVKKFSHKECSFGYRESFFKTKEGKKYIVVRIAFDLKKKGNLKTDYKDVQEFFENGKIISPTQKDVRDAIISIRIKKLPDISSVGTAGSFFKNPVVSKRKADVLKETYPNLPIFPSEGKNVKISAAFILDKICGFKGCKKGNVGTWGSQALVLVNYGGATTKEILNFAEEMKNKVKEKTGIDLEFEVKMIK